MVEVEPSSIRSVDEGPEPDSENDNESYKDFSIEIAKILQQSITLKEFLNNESLYRRNEINNGLLSWEIQLDNLIHFLKKINNLQKSISFSNRVWSNFDYIINSLNQTYTDDSIFQQILHQ